MTFDECRSAVLSDSDTQTLETRVLAKLGGRLSEFAVDDEDGFLVLRGKAKSFYVKQLAQHEVMSLTSQQIGHNRIQVER